MPRESILEAFDRIKGGGFMPGVGVPARPPEPVETGPLPTVKGLEGWREMLLLPGGIFASPQQENAFTERVSQPARCNVYSPRVGSVDHEGVPGSACNCGYYALYKRQNAHDYKGNCVVKISAMGETEMHEIGFRCAQFRIDEVYVQDKELAAAARERLGIDIFIEEAPCKSESESNALRRTQDQIMNDKLLQIFKDQAGRAVQDSLLQQLGKRNQSPPQLGPLSPPGLAPGGPLPGNPHVLRTNTADFSLPTS